jgi:hypothetical protein
MNTTRPCLESTLRGDVAARVRVATFVGDWCLTLTKPHVTTLESWCERDRLINFDPEIAAVAS